MSPALLAVLTRQFRKKKSNSSESFDIELEYDEPPKSEYEVPVDCAICCNIMVRPH